MRSSEEIEGMPETLFPDDITKGLERWFREIAVQLAGIREHLAAAHPPKSYYGDGPYFKKSAASGPLAAGCSIENDPPAVGNPMPDVLRSCAQTIEENRLGWQKSIEYLKGYAAAVGLRLDQRRPADPDCHSDVTTCTGMYCSACGEWIAPNAPAGRTVGDDRAGIGDGDGAPVMDELIGISGRPVGDPLAWPIVAPDGSGRFGVWFGPGAPVMTFGSVQEAENWIVRRREDEATVARVGFNPVRDYMGPVTPVPRHIFVRRLQSGLCDECGGGRLHVIHLMPGDMPGGRPR